MMAKMFYTLEEAQAALSLSEDQIKQLSRSGKLREFRDGSRLMFKADQIDALRADANSGSDSGMDELDLAPSDTGGPIGLADTGPGMVSPSDSDSDDIGSGNFDIDDEDDLAPEVVGPGASASMISLADTGGGSTGPGRSGASAAGMGLKSDTAMAIDASGIGMSSPGGDKSPGATGGGSGVTLLGADEATADPSEQTAINSAVSDQINLEGIGSGSGLLDLTRESDDTSLGAELLDEISPGGSVGGSMAGSIGSVGGSMGSMGGEFGSGIGGSLGDSGPVAVGDTGVAPAAVGPVVDRTAVVSTRAAVVEAADPMAPAFGAASLAAALCVLVAAIALAAAATGVSLRNTFLDGIRDTSIWYLFGGGVVLAVIFFVVGMFVGKARA